MAIGAFTGTGDPEWVPVAPGFGDLLLTAMMEAKDSTAPSCPLIFVEWNRRAEVQAEIDLQQSPAVDATTAVTPGQLITPSVMLTGVTHFENGQARYTVTMARHPEGSVIQTFDGTISQNGFLNAAEALARQILSTQCPQVWTAQGKTTSAGPGVTISGQVSDLSAPFQLLGIFQGGEVTFSYVPDASGRAGSVTYTLSGGGFTGKGSGSFTLSPRADGAVVIDQSTSGCIDGIPNSCRTTTEQVILTPSAG
ncbi:hypothetical protein ACSBLW_06455 [Thioclava sp. FR2]|uniref:hypothetical protein n=1 Tax=Thioclava sp. FR2 TaxID=3445780 RepID=UPI003EBF90F4